MLISIIVPVYNVEKYLEECLDSVLKQNISEYEIICVNDGSTDGSGDILKKYEAAYSRIKVIEHPVNMGLSAARNTAMKHAAGKYILFVDSDDMVAPNILRELYETSESNQLDILYFERSLQYEGMRGYRVKHRRSRIVDFAIDNVCTGREVFFALAEDKRYSPAVWRQFIRHSFLLENNIVFQEGIIYEDRLFSFLCAMKAQRVMNINKEFYIYRLREGSIKHTYKDINEKSMFFTLVNIFIYWNTHEFTSRENDAMAIYFQRLYNFYQTCRASCNTRNTEIEFGSYAAKALYKILYEKKTNRWLTLPENQINEIKKAQNVIVYGAGKAAKEVILTLKENNITIGAVAVDNANENPEFFYGVKVSDFRTLEAYKEESVIIIGVSQTYSGGIKETLDEFGFKNIIIPEAVKH